MEKKFDTVENCEKKLCEVRVLADIAEGVDGAEKTTLRIKNNGATSSSDLRT